MTAAVVARLRRILRKPPGYIARRLMHEAYSRADKYFAPARGRFKVDALLRKTGDTSLEAMWERLAQRPYPALTHAVSQDEYEKTCPGDRDRILRWAERACEHRVALMGSGPVDLGANIDWLKDYKTDIRWPLQYCRNISYSNLERPSDVKFPWEASRLQWLIPVGQAYLLTGEERYAKCVRNVLEQWIDGNPYAYSVNWSCTMEVALRIVVWTWFFQVFHASPSWAEPRFRGKFLCALYMHGDYTERYLEKSDINGNHYTADAAGLAFAGLFWGSGSDSERWARLAWSILCEELPRQVYSDGVDFEASVPYHRLVQELFLFPALYRIRLGLPVSPEYRARLISMAQFSRAYTRLDGSVPLVGDADDARLLPFGGQDLNDHRYLLSLVAYGLNAQELLRSVAGPRSEAFWLFGPEAMDVIPARPIPLAFPTSAAFREGGFYIMRNASDHVFIDCGPRGLAGRGGHGHNDVLSFEAALAGVHLVSDRGAFVYTGDYLARNRYRGTASHNTPQVAGAEINRFIRPEYLWDFMPDAEHRLLTWTTSDTHDEFKGEHTGYSRLENPIIVRRSIRLEHAVHRLVIKDEIIGRESEMEISIPFHFTAGVRIRPMQFGALLEKDAKTFELSWRSDSVWTMSVEDTSISPSYGVAISSKRLLFRSVGVPAIFSVVISPQR